MRAVAREGLFSGSLCSPRHLSSGPTDGHPAKGLAQQPVVGAYPAPRPPLLLLPMSVGLPTSHRQQGPSTPLSHPQRLP